VYREGRGRYKTNKIDTCGYKRRVYGRDLVKIRNRYVWTTGGGGRRFLHNSFRFCPPTKHTTFDKMMSPLQSNPTDSLKKHHFTQGRGWLNCFVFLFSLFSLLCQCSPTNITSFYRLKIKRNSKNKVNILKLISDVYIIIFW